MKIILKQENISIPKYLLCFDSNKRIINISSSPTKSPVSSHHFKFDTHYYHAPLSNDLSDRLVDLVDIAGFVYFADRIALRKPHNKEFHVWQNWKRDLKLVVPVRDLDFWNCPEIKEQLSFVLYFLTEDQWVFDFEKLHNDRINSQLEFPFYRKLSEDIFISLFSGGLDSFAGTVSLLNEERYPHTFLVSLVTNKRMYSTQKRLIESMKRELNLSIVHVPIRLHFSKRSIPDNLEEKTQRSRGFLFNVLGSVFAIHAGKNVLHLFENGIGALNLPMVDFQIGVDNTKAVHPLFLYHLSNLLSKVSGQDFHIVNLAQWLTKCELCKKLEEASLRNEIPTTVSCDGSFSRRKRKKPQCGICTSCLLRRQALLAAELAELDAKSNYQFDIRNVQSIKDPNRLFYLNAMRNQTKTISECLSKEDSWLSLCKAYPELEELRLKLGNSSELTMAEIQKNIFHLFACYSKEWTLFERQIHY